MQDRAVIGATLSALAVSTFVAFGGASTTTASSVASGAPVTATAAPTGSATQTSSAAPATSVGLPQEGRRSDEEVA